MVFSSMHGQVTRVKIYVSVKTGNSLSSLSFTMIPNWSLKDNEKFLDFGVHFPDWQSGYIFIT
jgi:hypothetical protein